MLIDAIIAIFRDIGFAIRSLRRTPGFTIIAILTLGLGIGANTSAFSVLNAVLLKPFPYADTEHLERIYRTTAQDSKGGFSPADYLDLKNEAGRYGEIAAYGWSDMAVSAPGQPPEMASGVRTTANLFSILGISPELGRGFTPDETILGNHHVLVLSRRYWKNHFGADPAVIGRTVRVDGEAHVIVGVLPESINDWRHLGPADLYRPLGLTDKEMTDRSGTWVRLVGRRSSSLTRAQAEAVIVTFGRRLAADFPLLNTGANWRTVPINLSAGDDNSPSILTMLIGLSGFVLLIACSNLANLLLARTMARAHELAVRAALGASRIRLLRPLLVESILLAFAGGLCALDVALWTHDWIKTRSTGDNGEQVIMNLDWRVLAWAFGASVFTVLAFSVVPALFALRLDLNRTLKSGGRGTIGDRGHQRFRHALIIGQFALAMILLAGAALFGRGLYEVTNRRSGWRSDQLATGSMLLPPATYSSDKKIADFQHLALQRLEALPGVASASFSYAMPFFGLAEPRKYLVAGRETPEPGHEPTAVINGVTPRYFETVGTPVLSGRAFSDADTQDSPRVFIINQAMARGLFNEESPLGRRIARAGEKTVEWGEIVGVVADTQSVSPEKATVTYQLYQPMAQEPRPLNEIAVRAAGVAPASLVADIRSSMAALDTDLPVRQLQPADVTIDRSNYQQGVLASMLSFLAALGLGLASLGIYGVIARTMAQRRGEFGIRLALGAQVRDIVRLVLGAGARLALVGSAIGLLGAFGISRMIMAGFPNIHTNSAGVLSGATLLLISIGLLASYMPARTASRIDPAETLRAE